MDTYEVFLPRNYFIQLGNFSDDDFRIFTQTHGIKANSKGFYPVFEIVSRLNIMRRGGKWGTNDADTSLKMARLKSIELATSIKSKEFIATDAARSRMKSILLATANKIRYAIKTTSPRLVNVLSARDVETILTDGYNSAVYQLLSEAEQLKTWEQYGFDSIREGGDSVVDNTDQGISSGSGEENKAIDPQQCP